MRLRAHKALQSLKVAHVQLTAAHPEDLRSADAFDVEQLGERAPRIEFGPRVAATLREGSQDADDKRDQVWTDGTRKAMSLAVRSATFAEMDLRKIRPSHVEAWVTPLFATG